KVIKELRNSEHPGSVIRTVSAQSLPIPPAFNSGDTPYEKQVYLLKNDLMVQKDVTLGRRIGFYKLGKELGAGNFSKVKLGIHILTREKVAVKIMERSRMDQKAQHLLFREIQAMEELHHPNIIRLFEVPNELFLRPMVDVWALGVLLYFMLVGNTPFRGETIADLRQSILKGFFDLPDYLSSFAQLIITRMLELNPEKRMTVFDIKKTFWLKDCKFANSYFQCTIHPRKDELEKNPLLHDVWKNLDQYGISEEMLREAFPKGPYNTIVGTYRIVLYQVQIQTEEQRQRIQKRTPMLNRSKTCNLF
uniref:non-specific serine/threonine protein kinase n=1 Tax=Syphacia muris TaxID=451379 RepID=A0A0N5AFD5_9BILA